VEHAHAPRKTVSGGHGDGAHAGLAHVLGDLERELLGVGEDVLLLHALHEQRVVDGGQLARLELDVDDRPDDLDDLPRAHASAPGFRASAPPPMSSSSLVIFSWRALLYWIVRVSLLSFSL